MKDSDSRSKLKFSRTVQSSDKEQDEINLELSKIYFGGKKNRRIIPDRRKTSERRNNKDPRDSNSVKNKHILIFSLLTLILLFLATVGIIIYKSNFSNDLPSAPGNVNSNTVNPIPEEALSAPPAPSPMVPALTSLSGKATLYDFEEDDDGWGIPAWALNLRDHVAISSKRSDRYSSKGNWSLRVNSKFPEKQWSASLVEIQHFLNLENFDTIAADVYFPKHSSKKLRGILILTQGEDWRFCEMSHSFRIDPGKWTTIRADISKNSVDWKKIKLDKYFRNDIRKIAIRIESTKTSYNGPIYIDNIRVYKQKGSPPDEN
jgi:hypothetical protein